MASFVEEVLRVVTAQSLESLMDSPRLPTIPAVAVQIVGLVQRPDIDIDVLTNTIARDPALSARVLKTANSGFYGRPRSVSRLRDAVIVLGLRSVKTLALGFSLVGNMRKQSGLAADHTLVWQRSLLTATAARAVATKAGYACSDEAFLGGLLHLIGVIALDQALGEDYRRICVAAGSDLSKLRAIERTKFGFDHAEAGAALAEKWNLPEALVNAIRMFPKPDNADRDFREIVRCVATGEAAADLVLSQDPSSALIRFRWDCEQLFGIDNDGADEIVEKFMADAEVLGSMLDVPGLSTTSEEVLARAQEALLQLTLESERENTQLHVERDRLSVEASTDALTGLANRRHLEEYLGEHFRISSRYGTPLSVIMFDIDRFKSVNDQHGHQTGDQVLRELAGILQATMRDADLCARYGGEEFVAILPATSIEGAIESAERVRAAVEKHVLISGGTKLKVTISAGVSTYRSGEQPGPEWLLKEADVSLYEAKSAGRNQVRAYQVVEASSPWSLTA